MIDKIKVWKCEECEAGKEFPCIANVSGLLCSFHPNWKETGEYAIVKTEQANTGIPAQGAIAANGNHLKNPLPESTVIRLNKMASNLAKVETPNCSLCRWRGEGEIYKDHGPNSTYENCTAQAYRICCDCYNTPECQALYEDDRPKTGTHEKICKYCECEIPANGEHTICSTGEYFCDSSCMLNYIADTGEYEKNK